MANEIQELKFQVGEAWKGVYSSSTPYSLANVVQDPTGLSIYRSLKSGNVGHPVTDASWWFRIIDLSSIKAESDRIKALNDAIADDEALRVAAEELRQQHEAERVAAEIQRNEAEQARINTEQQRVTKETQREANEQQRINVEQGRVSAESARVQAEQARALAETLRANAEDQRAANEQNRVAAEQQRIERAEQDHQRAESDHAAYVDSLGAFDISSYHAIDGVLAKYADITDAIGIGGANIPDTLRKGGMSVKFVQSSDNKYVQFRYMSSSTAIADFTNVANWQGVDKKPVDGSNNLIESGGIFKYRDSFHSKSVKGEIASGETLSLDNSFIRRNVVLAANITFNASFGGVELGRGSASHTDVYSLWVTVNSTAITIIKRGSSSNTNITFNHGLDITEFLNIALISEDYDGYVVVTSASGNYISDRFTIYGGGVPYIKNVGSTAISVTLAFCAKKEDVLVAHDNYGMFVTKLSNRWPYHLINNGINGFGLDGQTGWRADELNNVINKDIELYRPKYLVYELGMNDTPDVDSSTPNPRWLSSVNTIAEKCEAYGITLILCTIPNVPNRLHEGKNNWVKNSGYRYIDVAAAVGSQVNGTWYEGMLSTDNVHPTVLGAKAIAARVLSDFPEIAVKRDNTSIYDKINSSNTHLVTAKALYDYILQELTPIRNGIGQSFVDSSKLFNRNDVVITSDDVSVGDRLYMDLTCSNSSTDLVFYSEDNTPLLSRGSGTYHWIVPNNFSRAVVDWGNGTIRVNKMRIENITNKALDAKIKTNSSSIDTISGNIDNIDKSIGKEMFAAGKSFPKGQTVLTLDDVKPGDVLYMNLTCTGDTNLAFQTSNNTNIITRGNGAFTWIVTDNFDHAVTVWGNGGVTINSMYIKSLQNRQILNRVTTLENIEIYVAPSQGLAGIQDAIVKIAQSGVGGKIRLSTGTYSGDSAVSFSKYISSSVGTVYTNGLIIEGNGYGTYLTRNTSAVELVLNDTISDNIIVKNIRTNHQIQVQPANSKTRNISFENVWVQGRYYDEYKGVGASIVNIGADYFYKKFTEFQSALPNYGSAPLEVHIYGHITETEIPKLTMQNINFIGHNAVIEVANPQALTISIATVNCKFKGIHFIKSGCGNYWDLAAVTVYSYDSTFEDCVFENKSFSPTPFNQADWNVGGEEKRGSRRYGIEIASSKYGMESNLVFVNCRAIGSPYGFQNTRGFYILFGEPKLYNCVGIGGGVGEYGHGILSHRYSRPTLFNCIGYAGPMSYRMAAGIRIQCSGSPLMEGCIGYGGNNIQYKSNGVSYETLHAKCQELGISDESFFYDGSEVNYDGLTFKATDDGYNSSRSLLLGSLTIYDLDIETLNSNSIKNYGIGLWAGQNKARLINCVGYAGGGVDSCGLVMEQQNEPIIVGGYFGIEDMTDARYFKNDSGQQYMTFLPSRLNDYIPYTVTGMTLLGGDYSIQSGDKIRVETVEATPKLIAEDTINNLNINVVNITETDVDAGIKLKVSVVNNGVVKSIADNSIRFQIFYNYNNTGTSAMNVGASASPKITGTHFETNKASSPVVINSTRTDYNISGCKIVSRGNEDAVIQGQNAAALRMFNCVIEGDVDSGVTFAQTESVNGSSNIKLT